MVREIHIEPGYWQNLPESSGLWYDYNLSRKELSDRENVIQRVMPLIVEVIHQDLTDRQREVVTLYFSSPGLTQTSVARLLRISQPTVNQHLNGKKRSGKRIGGAMRRIRKAICRRTHARDCPNNGNKVPYIIGSLLSQSTNSRRAMRLLDSLRS